MEYPYVIVVNDKPETLFSPRDFEYLLEKTMGHDAVVYFRQMTEGKDTYIAELEQENDIQKAKCHALLNAIQRWRQRYEH